jgi:hypothetical protein
MTIQPLTFRDPTSSTFRITPAVRRLIERYFFGVPNREGLPRWMIFNIAIIARVRPYRGVRFPHLAVFLTRYLAAFRHMMPQV